MDLLAFLVVVVRIVVVRAVLLKESELWIVVERILLGIWMRRRGDSRRGRRRGCRGKDLYSLVISLELIPTANVLVQFLGQLGPFDAMVGYRC